jgi:transposase
MLVAGLRLSGVVAPMVLDGPINGDWFEAYVRHVLTPTLKSGEIVIMDNLSSYKRASARQLIEAVSAELRVLPSYSPDFNPIEVAFSSSGRFCERPPSRLSMAFGTPSDALSTSSHPRRAPTFSVQQAMSQNDRETL